MKVIIEVNPRSAKGAQLLKYVEKLKAGKRAVTLRQATEINDDEMGLPGTPPNSRLLNEWLRPDVNEPSYTLDEAKTLSKQYLEKHRLKKKLQKK
jgi:hypothetical protein